MTHRANPDPLGLEFGLQRPSAEDLEQIPSSRDDGNNVIFPEVDGGKDHLHFEMIPMRGESMLWLTIRRGTTAKLAASSLRKIATLIERHGDRLLNRMEGAEGSFDAEGEIVEGPLQLGYNDNGDLVFPKNTSKDQQSPR